MNDYRTIEVSRAGGTTRITLARPDIRNAFDEVLIAELTAALSTVAGDAGARVVVLTGKGKAFCAGADLAWMGKMKDYTYDENLADSLALAKLMRTLFDLPIPTIAAVNGPAIGGGNGLVAACDIAIAAESAVFSLSEVKLGLVPACIGPYVIRRIGERVARELFLTGRRIGAARAAEIGLVNEAVPDDRLAGRVEEWVRDLASSGPEALRICKELISRTPGMDLDEAGRFTAEMIARLRIGREAQEGIAAFFGKRKPRWAE
ncbi:MAG: enoyl-CoA hydratase/isomerase family protein [Planctomycetes bacterium]|jgi:methylglutaconyl-CoA hydratase|nr:enoyl-CoA hydratase/isomerase family protein [Planctomycetota bacterium]